MGRGNFEGEKGRPIVKYRDYRPRAAAMRPFCQITLGSFFLAVRNDLSDTQRNRQVVMPCVIRLKWLDDTALESRSLAGELPCPALDL